MKKNWWKWTGFLLVLYSLIAGLAVPLAPGIKILAPESIHAGSIQTFTLETVNARFRSFPAHLQIAFTNSSTLLRPLNFKVLSENRIQAVFQFPSSLEPGKGNARSLDLVVSSDHDGLLISKQALELTSGGALASGTIAHQDSSENKIATGNQFKPGQNSDDTDRLKFSRQNPVYFAFPYREILYETIRNTFYHIGMWFAMLLVFFISVVYSVIYLKSGKIEHDQIASQALYVGLFFGTLGLATGSLWAKYTWGDWWPNDAKLNGTLISLLLYFAYVVLRNALEDEEKKARISAVYNIFAFPLMLVLIMVLPRLTDSLHPGNGGNPAFSTHDSDNHLRMITYPAWIGWMLMSLWFLQIRVRLKKLEYKRFIQ